MRRAAIAVLAGLVLAACSGCAMYSAPVKPPAGIAFSNIDAPASTEFNEGTSVGTKTGRATAHSVLHLVAWGDASVGAAANNGDISTINYVDYRYFNVLGVYSSYTTVARGK